MLGDFASLDVQNTYRGSDAYEIIIHKKIYFLSYNYNIFFWWPYYISS
ncbi:hypothetical protein [Piscirickettsia salmonis]|nr:hypothetical protein [Piscirickettsia salmonis]QHS25694.1 hypothetical protein GW538_06780 [Piscirickettsia salmonis]QHS29321.1 hypothetical protein GW537_09615 [Piscirickettsia salmonis]